MIRMSQYIRIIIFISSMSTNQLKVISHSLCPNQSHYPSSTIDFKLKFQTFKNLLTNKQTSFQNLNNFHSSSHNHLHLIAYQMSSTQTQIVYMIKRLEDWGKQLGSSNARKKMSGCQFDSWQEDFLIKRHEIENLQNQKEKLGLNTKTASYGFKIRQGITELETAIGRMKEQNRKLGKKKETLPQHTNRRQKIIDNCEKLLSDIQQRQRDASDPNGYIKPTKVLTLTDMRAKLLSDIEQQNYQIHQQMNEGSEDQLADSNVQEQEAMKAFAQKDKQMDDALDDVIQGIQGVKAKVKQINQKQDEIIDKTKKNKTHVEKVSKRIETDNDKLKKIIKKFGPNRCCLAMVLLLLFIGLIVVIIKMFVLG